MSDHRVPVFIVLTACNSANLDGVQDGVKVPIALDSIELLMPKQHMVEEYTMVRIKSGFKIYVKESTLQILEIIKSESPKVKILFSNKIAENRLNNIESI